MKKLLLLMLIFLLAVYVTGFAVQAKEEEHAVDGYEFTILEEKAAEAQDPETRDANPATADRAMIVFTAAGAALTATLLYKKRAF